MTKTADDYRINGKLPRIWPVSAKPENKAPYQPKPESPPVKP